MYHVIRLPDGGLLRAMNDSIQAHCYVLLFNHINLSDIHSQEKETIDIQYVSAREPTSAVMLRLW